MKKLISLLMVLLMVFGSVSMVFAAQTTVFSQDTSLTSKFNSYDSLTLKEGVTLTTKMAGNEPQGIEMHGPLTLEKGARIVGSGIILMYRGSSVKGMDLWYKCRDNNEFLTFPDIATAYSEFQNAPDYVFQFTYDKAAQKWVWTDVMEHTPFSKDQPKEPQHGFKDAQQCADALHALHLLEGSGTLPDGSPNYSLDRPLSRCEAMVMIICLLGKSQEAQHGSYSHPFTDVPAWADKFVGYAYENDITGGVSATQFGTGNATGAMYITFLLRVMGYNDSPYRGELDFVWSNPLDLARSIGINIDDNQFKNFTRAEAVMVTAQALRSAMKDSRHLSTKLIENGVFPADQYEDVMRAFD